MAQQDLQFRSRPRARLVVSLGFILAGCSGHIEVDGASPGLDDSDEMGGHTGSAGGSRGGNHARGSCTPDPLPARIWRLTGTQYRNTVTRLFGVELTDLAAVSTDPINATTGFDNDAESLYVTPRHAQAYHSTAIKVADKVAGALAQTHPCLSSGAAAGCVEGFIRDAGGRAFRRPLIDEEITRYAAFFAASSQKHGDKTAAAMVVQAMLLSPHFLHRTELGEPAESQAAGATVRLTGHEVASALSYAITDAPPNDDLLEAAAAGRLTDREGVLEAARRLADGQDARAAFANFMHWQLHLDRLERLELETGKELTAAMVREPQMFVEAIMNDGQGTLETLYTAPFSFVDAGLAELYRVPVPNVGDFGRADLDPGNRFGVFTQLGVLTAHHGPVHRGRLIRESLLCEKIPDPSPEIVAEIADLPPPPKEETAAEGWQRFRAERPSCASCHALFQPLGVAFDSYDDLGRYRLENEAGRNIETSGEISAPVGWSGAFSDARDLVQQIVDSEQGRHCFVSRYLTYSRGRAIDDLESSCSTQDVARDFIAADMNLGALIVAANGDSQFFDRIKEE